MSVKHVCPNCGSTLTLDAPMPSLRCPKCKTTMQPETAVSDAAAQTATATPVRPMRVARTVSTIGSQVTTAAPAETERLLEEARFKAQQERDRLLVEANKQIQQAQAQAEVSLREFREQKLAEATAEASAIVEAANQNAAHIKKEAESIAQKRLEEAENTVKKRLEEAESVVAQQLEKQSAENQQTEQPTTVEAPQVVAAQPVESFEEQKAKIDKLARQNQIRFWRLNAYIAILILTLICAIKSNGNTLVAVLSSLSAIIAIGLAAYAIYTLRSCIALLKAEQNGKSKPDTTNIPSKVLPRKTPVLKIKKDKPVSSETSANGATNTEQTSEPIELQNNNAIPTTDVSATNTTEENASESAQPDTATPIVRKTLMPATKKKPSKPLFIKKKSSE